jgi:hypothetical protein
VRTRSSALLALILGVGTSYLAVAQSPAAPHFPQGTTQICIFNVGEKKLGIDDELKSSSGGLAHLPVTGFTGGGTFAIKDYFHSKVDSDALHSFQAFIQDQIQSGNHCDGLVISGTYSAGVYTGKGQLRVADVVSILEKPEAQSWVGKVKSVYMDGSQTMSAVMMINQQFPNAIVLGNDSDVMMNKFSQARKSKSKQFLEFAARLNATANAVVRVEQVQQSLDAVTTNPLLADPTVPTSDIYQSLLLHPASLKALLDDTIPAEATTDTHVGSTTPPH